jgi:hypothetical protein
VLLTNVATWSERHFSQKSPASTGTIYVWLGGEGCPPAIWRSGFASSTAEVPLTPEVPHHGHDSAVAFLVVRRKVKLQKDIGHVFLDRAH